MDRTVVDWLDGFYRLYPEIENATLPPDKAQWDGNLRYWVRTALNKADDLAGQVKTWNDAQRIAAVKALRKEPTDGGVPADRYFLRLCRVNVLYNVLTHVAWPDGTPCLEPNEHTWDMADTLFAGVRREVGWDMPLADGVVDVIATCIGMCRGLPRDYPPEEHAAQAALLFRALWATDES